MLEEISWTERVQNKEVLQRVKEETIIIYNIYSLYIKYILGILYSRKVK